MGTPAESAFPCSWVGERAGFHLPEGSQESGFWVSSDLGSEETRARLAMVGLAMVTLKGAASAEAIASCISLSPEHRGGCRTRLGASPAFWVSLPGNQAQPLPPTQAWSRSQPLVLGRVKRGHFWSHSWTLLWVGTGFALSGPQPFPGPRPLLSHLAGPRSQVSN